MEITEAIVAGLISLAFFAAIGLSFFYYLKVRHQERIALIEKGYQKPLARQERTPRSLRVGILLIGIALGLFIGYLFATYSVINPVVAYFSMILLFGGIGLIVNYYIEQKIPKTQD